MHLDTSTSCQWKFYFVRMIKQKYAQKCFWQFTVTVNSIGNALKMRIYTALSIRFVLKNSFQHEKSLKWKIEAFTRPATINKRHFANTYKVIIGWLNKPNSNFHLSVFIPSERKFAAGWCALYCKISFSHAHKIICGMSSIATFFCYQFSSIKHPSRFVICFSTRSVCLTWH